MWARKGAKLVREIGGASSGVGAVGWGLRADSSSGGRSDLGVRVDVRNIWGSLVVSRGVFCILVVVRPCYYSFRKP